MTRCNCLHITYLIDPDHDKKNHEFCTIRGAALVSHTVACCYDVAADVQGQEVDEKA